MPSRRSLMGLMLGAATVAAASTTEGELDALQRTLGVSDAHALVSDAHQTRPGQIPDFILIQDAHRHPEVQRHIESIILTGYRHWGLKKVFMEGAFTPIDLTMFHLLNERERMDLSDYLTHQGTLSGAERAGLRILEKEWRNPSVSPFQVIGMEEAELYRANVAAYRRVVQTRPAALREIERLRDLQASLKMPPTHLLSRQLSLIEKLVQLRLIPSEYEEYLHVRPQLPDSAALNPAREAAEEYYALVERRSWIFLEEAQRKAPAAPGPRVLVIGGFHSARMAEMLRDQGKSFVVLTPRATQPFNDALYERRLLDTSCSL